MSWSVNFVGTPENIINALKAEVAKFCTPDSKAEYEKALPYLIGVVSLNYDKSIGHKCGVQITANGHSYTENGEPRYGSCNVEVRPAPGLLV